MPEGLYTASARAGPHFDLVFEHMPARCTPEAIDDRSPRGGSGTHAAVPSWLVARRVGGASPNGRTHSRRARGHFNFWLRILRSRVGHVPGVNPRILARMKRRLDEDAPRVVHDFASRLTSEAEAPLVSSLMATLETGPPRPVEELRAGLDYLRDKHALDALPRCTCLSCWYTGRAMRSRRREFPLARRGAWAPRRCCSSTTVVTPCPLLIR